MSSSPKRLALYARVSTGLQSVDLQIRDLRRYSEQRHFLIHEEYIDNGFSGSKDSRPALNQLMASARKRHFDAVLVWRFDRWARSTKHLIESLLEFKNLGIEFLSYQENLDTGSPMGQAMFTIIAALGQLERDIIVQRVKAGMSAAKARGKHLGRPQNPHEEEILRLREKGRSFSQISKALGVSNSTISNVLSRRVGKISA